MKKLFFFTSILLATVFFSTNILAINVRFVSKKYYNEPGLPPRFVHFPITIYLAKEPIYNTDPLLEYIGYITIYNVNHITYTEKGNNPLAITNMNYNVNLYCNTNGNIFSVPTGSAPAKSWNGLYILLHQAIHDSRVRFLHIITGQYPDDSFIPQYEINDKRDYNVTYTLLNPLSNMLTVEYSDMPDDFSDLFSNMPHEKEGNLK